MKTIIFDFDGVIANTDEGRYKLLNDILPDYGLALEESDYTKMIGLSTKSFLKQNYTELTETEINSIVSKRHELFFNNLDKYCIPFKGTIEIIQKLSKDFQLIIATTNASDNVKKQLKFLNVDHFFKYIFGREVMENGSLLKDYSSLAVNSNFNIKESIVIEDSETGILAAKKSGYFCIEFNPINKDKNEQADYRVKDYQELYNLILSLNKK